MTSKELAKLACDALDDKKHLKLKLSTLKTYLPLQIISLSQAEQTIIRFRRWPTMWMKHSEEPGYEPKQIEGYQNANWILMDYRDIVIHIFDEENRLFYDLERIWRDGTVVEVEDLK